MRHCSLPLLLLAFSSAATASVPTEILLKDEARLTEAVVAQAIKDIERKRSDITRRDVHAKAHGCLSGTLVIDPARPAWTRSGLYAFDKTYKVWSRFSNAGPTVSADKTPDARGAALKVLDVVGPKLIPSDPGSKNLDLLFVSEPITPVKDLAGYLDAQKLITGEKGAVSYLLHHPISTVRLAKMAWDGEKVTDPLFAKYYSSAPYLLGAEAAKYQLVPCSPEKITPPPRGQDSLRAAIAAHLKAGDACFAILAQRFIDESKTPIENFSKEWTNAVAPPVKVATVTFKQQTFDTPAQNQFCENLSFNPWRTLPNQRPLGSLNRVRKAIYEAVAARRHADNHAQRKEPDGTEKF